MTLTDRPAPHLPVEQWHRDDLLAEVYRQRDRIKTEQQGRINAQRRVEALEARLEAMGDKRNAAGQFHGEIGKRTKRDLTEVARLREEAKAKDAKIATLLRLTRVYVPLDVRQKAGI